MQSLFIIGTQRSGSNLLRLMLNQLNEIAAPHPPHILQNFIPLLPAYGDMQQEENFMQLAQDVCNFIMANPVAWEVDLCADVVAQRAKSRTLFGIYQAVHELFAEHNGASIWCCKSMANTYFIPQIEKAGLRPYYIHLVRDGRDVACSFKKAIVGEKHIYHLAGQWAQDQNIARNNAMEYAAERYVLVLYENLIHDTENTLKILMHSLGLQYNERMLHYNETHEAAITADAGKMWANVTKPVIATNSNKFLKQLSEEEILIFESVAGDTLQLFGYQPYFAKEKWLTAFTPQQVSEFNRLNAEMKQAARQGLDPEGIAKRKKQESVLAAIHQRLTAGVKNV